MTFGVEKLEWCGYSTVKKMDLDIRLFVSTIYERDRRTDTRPPLHRAATNRSKGSGTSNLVHRLLMASFSHDKLSLEIAR